MTAPGVWPFLPRRRRERTIAGGTRAFVSAYHRNNEAHENRTLNRVRGFLAPCWGADSYGNHHPGVTLAALANPRLISRHASGVAKTAKLQSRALAGFSPRPGANIHGTGRCAVTDRAYSSRDCGGSHGALVQLVKPDVACRGDPGRRWCCYWRRNLSPLGCRRLPTSW